MAVMGIMQKDAHSASDSSIFGWLRRFTKLFYLLTSWSQTSRAFSKGGVETFLSRTEPRRDVATFYSGVRPRTEKFGTMIIFRVTVTFFSPTGVGHSSCPYLLYAPCSKHVVRWMKTVIYWRDAVQWDVKTMDKHPDDERGSTGRKYKNLVL